MFKSIELNNFQSHKNSVLEFSPGMNVLIGPSDSGKTAILRAFGLLINNRPGGDSYRSNWGGDTFVKGVLVEGVEVTRTKSKKENSYTLSTYAEPFLAFGQDVPVEIRKALDLSPVNIQSQMDAPFLLSETSGNIATHFNKIAKLEKIDKSRNYIQSEINSINSEIKETEKQIEYKSDQLKELPDLGELTVRINEAAEYQSTLVAEKTASNNLEGIINSLEEINLSTTLLLPSIKSEDAINSALKLMAERDEISSVYRNLKKLAVACFYKGEEIASQKLLLSLEPKVDKALETFVKRDTARKLAEELENRVEDIETTNERVKIALKWIEKKEEFFHANFPDICPLCETPQQI